MIELKGERGKKNLKSKYPEKENLENRVYATVQQEVVGNWCPNPKDGKGQQHEQQKEMQMWVN